MEESANLPFGGSIYDDTVLEHATSEIPAVATPLKCENVGLLSRILGDDRLSSSLCAFTTYVTVTIGAWAVLGYYDVLRT